MRTSWLVAVALLALPVIAHADNASESQLHVDNATRLHGENKLAEAASELAIAYALDAKPELLFAIGQVEVKLDHCGLAIAFYTRFLASNPDTAAGAYEAIETCKKREAAVDAKAEAKRRIAGATKQHDAGQFEAARGELVVAYALDPDPALLFAIAQLHVKLDQCDRAIPFYERFVAQSRGTDAGATEAIETCKARLAKPVDKPPPPPPPRPRVVRTPAASPWYRDGLGLGLAATGVAAAAVGIVFYTRALGDLDDADAATTLADHQAAVDDAHSHRTVAAVFGAGAVVLTGVAAFRFVSHRRHHETSHAVTARSGSAGPRSNAKRCEVTIVPTRAGGFVHWQARF